MCAASALGIGRKDYDEKPMEHDTCAQGQVAKTSAVAGTAAATESETFRMKNRQVNGKDFCTAPFSLETVTAEVVRSKISKVTLKPKFRQRYKHGQKGCDLPVDATLLCDIGRSFAESH